MGGGGGEGTSPNQKQKLTKKGPLKNRARVCACFHLLGCFPAFPSPHCDISLLLKLPDAERLLVAALQQEGQRG